MSDLTVLDARILFAFIFHQVETKLSVIIINVEQLGIAKSLKIYIQKLFMSRILIFLDRININKYKCVDIFYIIPQKTQFIFIFIYILATASNLTLLFIIFGSRLFSFTCI